MAPAPATNPQPAPAAPPSAEIPSQRDRRTALADLGEGLALCRSGHYQEARTVLVSAADSGQLTRHELCEALRFAAACAFWEDDLPGAQSLFERLFATDPSVRIDAQVFPPELCEFAEQVRQQRRGQ